jgi:predicted transcriptional regulator
MSRASATARARAARLLAGRTKTAAPLWAGDKERRITAQVPPDLDRHFTAIAKARGVSKGGLARELIKSFVSRQTVAPAGTGVAGAANADGSAA